jgi:uncharacterized phage protein (TIGR02220 family)
VKTIFKSCRDTHFVKIANSMLRDKRLSMGARGLLAMILTHSEEWVVTKSWLIDQGPDGYDAISSMLKELSSFGYAVNEKQGRDASGGFTKSVWMFSDEGIEAFAGKSTVQGNPCTVSRVPLTASRQTHTKKTIRTEDNQTEDTVGKGFPTPQPTQGTDCSDLEANPEAEPKGSGEETPTPPAPLSKKPDKLAAAKKVLAHLNASTGRQFRETGANLSFIDGRLQEAGVDVDGCLQMVSRQCQKWSNDPKMKDYLRPETLFNKTKFDSYYAARAEPVQDSSSQKPWEAQRDKRAQIAALEDQILYHPGNIDGRKCTHPQFTSQATFDECDTLRSKLKALQAELAAIPA